MLKLMKYMKGSVKYIICIILLLFLQANCDLALPDYTSRIVNVGIQQQGIEDGVPEKIRESSLKELFLFMEEEDQKTVEEAYTKDGELYLLNKIDKEQREVLNEILSQPMMIAQSMKLDSAQMEKMQA